MPIAATKALFLRVISRFLLEYELAKKKKTDKTAKDWLAVTDSGKLIMKRFKKMTDNLSEFI